MSRENEKPEPKRILINFEVDRELKEKLIALSGRFGQSRTDTLRQLISDAYGELVPGREGRPVVGSLSFDLRYGERLEQMVEQQIPGLQKEVGAQEEELRDVRMRLLRIERQLGIKEDGDEEDQS